MTSCYRVCSPPHHLLLENFCVILCLPTKRPRALRRSDTEINKSWNNTGSDAIHYLLIKRKQILQSLQKITLLTLFSSKVGPLEVPWESAEQQRPGRSKGQGSSSKTPHSLSFLPGPQGNRDWRILHVPSKQPELNLKSFGFVMKSSAEHMQGQGPCFHAGAGQPLGEFRMIHEALTASALQRFPTATFSLTYIATSKEFPS